MAYTTAAELQYWSCSEPGKPGKPFPALVWGQEGGRAGACLGFGRCCHPLQVWLATVFVSHFTAAFQAMPKQKFGFFCMPATLPVIYTPPCYLLCNVEFFRKDHSHPGEEKLICSISPTKPGHFHRLLPLNPQVYLFLKKHKEIR